MTTRIAMTRSNDTPPRDTPWGPSQGWTQIADGIWTTSTASHGGVWMAEWRKAQLLAKFPGFQPYCGDPNWYEEDCDWALPAVLFDQDWKAEQVQAAINTVRLNAELAARTAETFKANSRVFWHKARAEGWAAVVAWLDGPEGQQMQARTHKRLAESHAAAKLLGDQTPA